MLQRIGIIGDVHAQADELRQAIESVKQHEVDAIVCVGDIPLGSKPIGKCCDLLVDHDVEVVLGNHDQWLVEDLNATETHAAKMCALQITREHLEWFRGLPLTRTFETANGKLLLCHGTNENNMSGVYDFMTAARVPTDPDLYSVYRDTSISTMVAGHTHEVLDLQLKHLRVLNPGMLGPSPLAGFLVYDTATERVTLASSKKN